MNQFSLARRLVAEFMGTAFLLAGVVGSGIMAQSLTNDPAIALLCNAIATGAILVVLIGILGPISGAHFNPAVSMVFTLRGELAMRTAPLYILAQISGAVLGVVIAHAMFGQAFLQVSDTLRTGEAKWFAEFTATFGLVVVILGSVRFSPAAVTQNVGLYITAAYWFTASTSFANPAAAIARAFTDSFAGIHPANVPAFALAEIAGALAGFAAMQWLLDEKLA